MHWRVVFDIATAGYKCWTFPAFGLVALAMCLLIDAKKRAVLAEVGRPAPRTRAFPRVIVCAIVLWTTMAFLSTWTDYRALRDAATTGRTRVAEGIVTGFAADPKSERFCVSGACFTYSDAAVTAGFNMMRSHGGPMREGLSVRVTSLGGEIAKLEVAD